MGPIDIRLSHLRNVLLVADTRSYRAAALRAYRSQPALSQAIRQMELKLGAPLFEPESRTTLTPFGERCLPILRDAVEQFDRAIHDVRRLADASTGHLTVAILPSVAQQWLPWLLRDFGERHPGIELRVFAEDSGAVQRLVENGDADLGISSRPSVDSKLLFHPLLEDRFGVLCPRGHRFSELPSLPWSKLDGEPILGSTMHQQLEGTRVAKFLATPRIHVANLPTLVALVRAGIGLLPLPATAHPVLHPDLAFVPLVRPVTTRQIGLLSAARRSLMPAAAALVRMIRAHLEEATRSADRSKHPGDRSAL